MDYLYLRAWERMMNSGHAWRQAQLTAARKDKAPENAIYKDHNGVWRTFDYVTVETTRDTVIRLIGDIRKDAANVL